VSGDVVRPFICLYKNEKNEDEDLAPLLYFVTICGMLPSHDIQRLKKSVSEILIAVVL